MPLATAIRLLLRETVEPLGVATHVDDRIAAEPAGGSRTVILRIVEEALKNVQQHANARSVVIAMESHDSGVLVTIEDNGTGFDPVKAFELPDDQLGLRVMRERAQMQGGWLRAESAIGHGSTIKLWIPDRTPGAR